MQDEKIMELLIDLSNKFSELKKDVEYIKSEMHANYVRSDEADDAMRERLEDRQDAIKTELEGKIELLKKENELQARQIEAVNARLDELDNKDAKKVMSRWEQIKDKVFFAVLMVLGYAVFAVLNLNLPPHPKM